MILTSVSTAAVAAAASAAAPAAAGVGFFAWAAGFISGWAVLLLGVLALFGILSEHNESSGWAVFWLIIAGAVAFIAFDVSLIVLAVGAVAYVVIGFIWSFYRYKRHAMKIVEKYRDQSSGTKERALEQLHPKNMLGTITSWVIVWPFSVVSNIGGDLINFIQSLISKFFRGIYFRIYDAAVAALK